MKDGNSQKKIISVFLILNTSPHQANRKENVLICKCTYQDRKQILLMGVEISVKYCFYSIPILKSI